MSFDYTSLITDRAVSDSDTLKALLGKPMAEWTAEELAAFNRAVMKGSYDYTDLNRVDDCLEDLVARLGRVGCNVPGYERLKIERTVTPSSRLPGYERVKIPRTVTPSSRLPEGYTELKYIQSTGTQYVDTGVTPTVNTRFSFGVYMLEQTGACIIGNSLNDDNDYRIFNYSGDIYWDFKDSRLIGTSGSFPEHTYFEFECGNNYVKKNGQEILTGQTISAFSSDANIFAFSSGNSASGGCSGRVFFLRILDGDALIRDFIPCRNPSGEAGLYDLVEGEFYGNAGTGVFFGGPPKIDLPESYTQLEYIQSNGQQYIDTGITPDQDTQIVYDCERLSAAAAEHFFGVRTGNGANRAFCFYIYNSRWQFAYNSTVKSATGPAAGRYLFNAYKNLMEINGRKVMRATYAKFTATSTALLFSMRSAPDGLSYGSHKLFTCQIYDNGTLTRNFIPCKNATGAVGLYDTVGAEFYPNAGTGSFTAGETVTWPEEPDADLDPYIWYESDVPVPSQMARYRANVAAVRGALALPEGTPAVPSTMRQLTPAAANSIEAVLLTLDMILNNLPAAVRHCGVTVCGSKGVIA